MDGSNPETMVRQNLMERLLNSVKQVQVYFGASQEIATESDARVSALCVEWEMVLTHAARKPKPKNSLRLTGKCEGVSLWPLAKLCVSAEDLQRFYRLNHVKSELGRGRAWLRGAINERTLENYMHTVVSQEEELRKLYEPDAFLLDQERSSMLPIMAAGLSSIIFSIATDANYLNTPSRSVEVPVLSPPAAAVPCVEVPHTQQPIFPPAAFVPCVEVPRTQQPILEEQRLVPPIHQDHSLPFSPTHSAETTHPSFSSHPFPSSLHVDANEDDVIAVRAKGRKKKPKKSKSRSPHLVDDRIPDENSPDHVMTPPISFEVDKTVPLKESASSSSSRLSLDSVNDDGQAPLYVALTTSTDLVSGEARAAASATALVLSASSAPLATEQYSPPATSKAQDDSQESQYYTDGNMRTAMLSLSKMKDDLELRNRELHEHVSELKVKVCLLEQELDKNMQDLDVHSGRKLALEGENDLLREQLKKYVNIVQAQRRDSPSVDSEVIGSFKSTASCAESAAAEDTFTTADKKLHDMAEMHADLMELNERLHRNLADKDVTICSLVHLLREANIEVPLTQHQLPAAAMETRVRLVEVWIPSVIKKGRGPDGFHVYQVFVSVKGVEWNVYRRYTEFRDFHRQLQKHLPEVATFNFPPKKAIGNKSTQVVEERRHRLQEYLRFVIKTCGSKSSSGASNRSKPIINRSISKEVLVSIFPFFKEDFNQDTGAISQPPSYSGL